MKRCAGEGRLPCEVPGCAFDFLAVYGEIGTGYAQVHHRRPLSDRTRPSETRLSELVVVCANCHVMIHRGGECRPLETLLAGSGATHSVSNAHDRPRTAGS